MSTAGCAISCSQALRRLNAHSGFLGWDHARWEQGCTLYKQQIHLEDLVTPRAEVEMLYA